MNPSTFSCVSEALVARADLRKRYHDVTAAIFRLKRDDEDRKVDGDEFDDRRMELNGEARHLEDQIAIIDAWVEERRAGRADKDDRAKDAKHERQTRHEIDLVTAKGAAEVERERLRLEVTKVELERDQVKAARDVATSHATLAKRIAGCIVDGDDTATVERVRRLLAILNKEGGAR